MIFRILHRQLFFFMALLLFTIAGIACLAILTPRGSFIQLNFLHTPLLDTFFNNCTFLGDGIFTIGVFFILMLESRITLGIQVLITYIFSGILAQIIKNIVAAPRPKTLLTDAEYHYFIEGMTRVGYSSFPSGHTTSVFALACLLTLHTHNRKTGLLYFALAALTGYSRIYLGHHFLQDVIAGALLGVLCALLVYWLVREVKIEWKEQERQPFTRLSIQ